MTIDRIAITKSHGQEDPNRLQRTRVISTNWGNRNIVGRSRGGIQNGIVPLNLLGSELLNYEVEKVRNLGFELKVRKSEFRKERDLLRFSWTSWIICSSTWVCASLLARSPRTSFLDPWGSVVLVVPPKLRTVTGRGLVSLKIPPSARCNGVGGPPP